MGSKLGEVTSLNSALEVASLWMIENRGIGNTAARGFERRIPLLFLGVADGAFAPEAWVGNGVPTLPWNHVVSLRSRLSVFHGRDDHAPFFLSLRHCGSA